MQRTPHRGPAPHWTDSISNLQTCVTQALYITPRCGYKVMHQNAPMPRCTYVDQHKLLRQAPLTPACRAHRLGCRPSFLH
eukprot:1157585-Pelagomonas_calceolata.AAC.4